MALELSILSLNVWGIPFISKDRDIRIKAIGQELATGKYDIVSLQEVWTENDYQYLKNITNSILPFAHYFYSGVFGSGLCVLSKFPIISALYHAWSVNGYVHRIQHGDWFGGKGVGLCKINIDGKIVHFYSAHLHAEYNRNSDDYLTHRVIQAFDTAQFIENTRGSSILQILAGDLNTLPGDLAYRVLITTSLLADSYTKSSKLQGTNECAKNSYTAQCAADEMPEGKRIDFIMHRPGYKYESKILEYRLPFPERIPEHNISYSDHEAVFSKVRITKLTPDEVTEKLRYVQQCSRLEDIGTEEYCSMSANMKALEESIRICDESLQALESHRKTFILMAIAVVVVLFSFIDIGPPYGFKPIFLIIKIILSGLILFFIFMATIWNVMERHGILSGKLSMEIALKNLNEIMYNNVESVKHL